METKTKLVPKQDKAFVFKMKLLFAGILLVQQTVHAIWIGPEWSIFSIF